MIASIIDSSDDAIYSKSLEGTILSWNRSAERMFGYRPEEIIGRPGSLMTPDDRADEIPHILERIKKGERIDHYETIRKRKDGGLITISLTVSPIKDSEGTIIAASSIARDITSESRNSDIRNFLASIVDSSDDAILSKDLNGIILSWNLGAQRLYGYSPEEIVGHHVSILAPPDLPDDIPNIMERLNKGERIDHYETTRVTKDGRKLSISLTVSPILDTHGRVIAASAIARDITARKHDELEKARLVVELEKSLAQKNILLQEVYHRVKNNLQVISSLLNLRSKYAMKNPEQASVAFRESIERIRAISLVHEKLYQAPDLEKLDFVAYLRALIDQVVHAYAINKKVELKISGEAFEVGLGTAISLGLILNELVTNSLKHAFALKHEGTIEIRCTGTSDALHIEYCDDGAGLPPDVDFETADSFGFRIVKLLIKQLQGSIAVSGVNRTTFHMTILKPQGGL